MTEDPRLHGPVIEILRAVGDNPGVSVILVEKRTGRSQAATWRWLRRAAQAGLIERDEFWTWTLSSAGETALASASACGCGHEGKSAHPCHGRRHQCRQPAQFRAAGDTKSGEDPVVTAWACEACWAAYREAVSGLRGLSR